MNNSNYLKSAVLKGLSLFLVLTFSVYNVSFAVPKQDAPTAADINEILSVDDIGIAIDIGSVKSRYDGSTDKVIVHIQDAHCNYEAQTNINKMLEQLTKECGISMISVEGAEGIVDTAWFRAFPDSEIRKEVATYFMKKGEITGAEFFSIISDYEGTIFGAETKSYYIKNLKAFTEVYPYKNTMEDYFTGTQMIANRLKSMVYNPKLKRLDSRIRAFDDKKLELSDFAAYLSKTALVNAVDLSDYGDFKKLLQTLEYEEKIDFDIVDQERSTYIDSLAKKMSKENMTELVAWSIRFKKGHIKAVDFYSFLRELAREYDIPIIQEYPNLFYYYVYTKLYDGIDNETLFKEIGLVKKRLKKEFFQDQTQEKLDKYSEMLDMFVDLINIELTNDDYDIYKEYSNEFSIEDVLSFLRTLCNRYNLGYSFDEVPPLINKNIPHMVDFYEIAMKRDDVIINNTLKRMEKEGKDRCVLIAGGFHTRGIKNLLEEKGISYVVVTPKITKDVETPYIKVLTNQRTSLEDIITESAVMPGVNAMSGVNAVKKTESKLLSPLLMVAYTINLLLEPGEGESLRELSEAIGRAKTDGTATVEDATVTRFSRIVDRLTARWTKEVKADLLVKMGNDRKAAAKEWNTFVRESRYWERLLSAHIAKYQGVVPGMTPGVRMRIEKSFKKARVEERATAGGEHIRFGPLARVPYTAEERELIDRAIEATLDATEAQGSVQEEQEVSTGGTFVILEDELYDRFAKQFGAPLDLGIHPGTRGTGKKFLTGELQLNSEDLQKRFYIRRALYEKLSPAQRAVSAAHENMHIEIALGFVRVPEGMNEEDFVNSQPGCNVAEFMTYIEEHTMADFIAALRASAETTGPTMAVAKPGADTPLGRIITAVEAGTPIYLRPYENPKVWGSHEDESGRIIGEYWYGTGVESPEESSIAVIGEDTAPMADILAHVPEKVLGRDAVANFGPTIPLVKILTPKKRLSVQFHAVKSELWVVTDIDRELAGNNPRLIIGFSEDAITQYGDEVLVERYHEALKEYGEVLNVVIKELRDGGYGIALNQAKDVFKAVVQAAKVNDIKYDGLRVLLEEAREKLERFYGYREVHVGSIVAIPSGTLHALTPGIQVVEPQITGSTQSLEDGATYPVRYAFPDFPVKTAQKTLDLDQIGKMHPEVVKESAPEIISGGKDSPVTVERMPGGFKSKGLEVHRITLEDREELRHTDNVSCHYLTVVDGEAGVVIGNKGYDIPTAQAGGGMLLIPATAKEYTIIVKGKTTIIDTFVPTPEVWRPILSMETGEEIPGTGVPGFTVDTDFMDVQTGLKTTDVLNIVGRQKAPVPAIISGRAHTLRVTEGVVEIAMEDDTTTTLREGEVLEVEADYVDIALQPMQNEENPSIYEIVNPALEKAVVRIDYQKDQEERTFYAVNRMFAKHVDTLRGQKIRLIVPKQIYSRESEREAADGIILGSLRSYKELWNSFGLTVDITLYDPSLGLDDLKRLSIAEDTVGVFIPTRSVIKAAKNASPGARKFLLGEKGAIRTLPAIPDIHEDESLKDNGWCFAHEIQQMAFMLAGIDIGDVLQKGDAGNMADDYTTMIRQVADKDIGKEQVLYSFSYTEITEAAKDKSISDLFPDEVLWAFMSPDFGWLRFLNGILDTLVMKPFDPTDQLHQRRKVMWAV